MDETYRSIKDSFWTDILILDLLPDEKLFYLWLITNQHLEVCGCYPVSLRMMEYETGLSRESIEILIQRFTEMGRIKYNSEHREVILLKWKNNNPGFFDVKNKNIIVSIKKALSKVKTPEFVDIILEWLGEGQAPYKPLISPLQAPYDNITEHNVTKQNLTEHHQPQMTLDVIRRMFREKIGQELGGGVNQELSLITQNYTVEAIEFAILAAATRHPKPKNPFMYFTKVLEGRDLQSNNNADTYDPAKTYPPGSFYYDLQQAEKGANNGI